MFIFTYLLISRLHKFALRSELFEGRELPFVHAESKLLEKLIELGLSLVDDLSHSLLLLSSSCAQIPE